MIFGQCLFFGQRRGFKQGRAEDRGQMTEDRDGGHACGRIQYGDLNRSKRRQRRVPGNVEPRNTRITLIIMEGKGIGEDWNGGI